MDRLLSNVVLSCPGPTLRTKGDRSDCKSFRSVSKKADFDEQLYIESNREFSEMNIWEMFCDILLGGLSVTFHASC